ncbi:mycothiol synthase [Arthrobacter sp. TES]|uniref:Mycothiol acetyltransferase n=1 Tax=Paenarthrobacter ureafaciens TaxID=37931 RepID=A0AAX3EES4_PAEUR|nr:MULTISPECIES: mycothiol synthase [Paenarthrobacter]AOY70251.1 mycothiol acetyltransferase [Arthrobacter sp. ZXY-2]ERI37796.1 mycothiol acetyltransferase [Arthrobacter sp. AK-YN10]NKR10126.1 mycothiol synthase [Arthrobacter sp. M5]NKR14571.1 mycothiol synthase [Arthrobacter sp. M6]OEH60276.1 mycothiol synthase [Arthrobacter sp. D4]OEH60891.1 mycothiol synthase [Arthrobacter sp. D2]QOI62502.1 mycothiol synthase [Arthrobacter sp. TES]BCW85227.1 mycothiol acetyltransferase [Arthrobacter sp. 
MSHAHPENWPVLFVDGALDAELFKDFSTLGAAAAESDGNPPLSEQTLVTLRGSDGGAHRVLSLALYAPDEDSDPATAEDLAGIAVVIESPDGTGVLELAVHPSYRNRGVAGRLLAALQEKRGFDGLTAWSHGNHEAAAELASRFGYGPVRELRKMRLMSSSSSLPDAALPPGVTLRAFVPGQDEQAWLAANRAAFAHHPEQGSMTLADLKAREEEAWFDPEGFLLAVDADGTLLGYHWTKVHPKQGPHPAIGEVYVVGVTPDAQGSGLGKALTVAGIRHLQEKGLHAVMLYVDADNEAAVALYRKLGFVRWDTDVMYGPLPGN